MMEKKECVKNSSSDSSAAQGYSDVSEALREAKEILTGVKTEEHLYQNFLEDSTTVQVFLNFRLMHCMVIFLSKFYKLDLDNLVLKS